ncbi:hypothetical protein ACFPYM_01270 [Methylobacterium hispanicum]|nr:MULTISPECIES: hypothetical protein [Methylobacterium]
MDDAFDDELNGDDKKEHKDHTWYDYRLFSGPGELQGLVSTVACLVDRAERASGLRQRARRPKDEASFLLALDNLVSNLSYVIVKWNDPRPLVVSRKKGCTRDRNTRNLPVKTFLSCLDALILSGLVDQKLGAEGGRTTTIEPTPALLSMIRGQVLSFGSFRREPEDALVVLKRVTKVEGQGRPQKPRRDPVPLPFSPEVRAMSDQIAGLNAFLKDADLSFIDDGLIPQVDTAHYRTLVRTFTIRGGQDIRLDQGGRLYGQTFWLNLASERRSGLRIDGEPVADLDFVNLGPRIGYALLGQEPPSGDLYDLSGLLPGYDHSNRDHRRAIKQAFAACLNGGAGGSRGINQRTGKPGILAPLPAGTTAAKVRAAIFEKHPGFEVFYERAKAGEVAVGFAIMFKESCILLSALERLKDEGVVGLPFHDGLMVARSKAQIAKDTLTAASRDVLGVELIVELKAVYGEPELASQLIAA